MGRPPCSRDLLPGGKVENPAAGPCPLVSWPNRDGSFRIAKEVFQELK